MIISVSLSIIINYIVNNVYLLGGAISVRNKEDWADALSVVNGTTHNLFCNKDYILQLYRAIMFKYPIGLGPIMEKKEGNECDDVCNRIRLENHDVTSEAHGHTYYRENLSKILKKINFIG